ncbi:MAG: hypothetical protein LAT62_04525 [Natronospirillum sp.]|uniref:hypothetical protein n=1 Tax=Natronospirillum sp. TaxID=2812955 RepID=UPI0025DAF4A8|nr:hypothetical protein [Natronospirillum sp.]MCH8551179.1 hypothetical protein [Natronospirillum sp.]
MFNRLKLALALLGLSSFSYAAGPIYTGLFSNVAIRGYDPEAFDIVEGRLYLNFSPSIQTRWQADRSDFIQRADRQWVDLSQD